MSTTSQLANRELQQLEVCLVLTNGDVVSAWADAIVGPTGLPSIKRYYTPAGEIPAASVAESRVGLCEVGGSTVAAVTHIGRSVALGRTQNANAAQQVSSGATVTRPNTGDYVVTFDTPLANDEYVISLTLEDTDARDDVVILYDDVTAAGFNVFIREQDNGGTAGVAVNRSFSFHVLTVAS